MFCGNPSSDADFVGATFSHKGRRKERRRLALMRYAR